jgi:hydrocephalus-inducing protein
LEVSPSTEISINPKERKDIEITFHPKTRIHSFKADLNYKIVQNQEKRKLLSMQTAAHGVELKLMEETIGFGTVVMNSKISKVVQLANLGDIGTRYDWDTTFCEKFFTIVPKKGYLPAHEDLNFEITFHPNVPNHDINFKIKCNIEGSDPLFMNLLGKCIDQPKENIQELKF